MRTCSRNPSFSKHQEAVEETVAVMGEYKSGGMTIFLIRSSDLAGCYVVSNQPIRLEEKPQKNPAALPSRQSNRTHDREF